MLQKKMLHLFYMLEERYCLRESESHIALIISIMVLGICIKQIRHTCRFVLKCIKLYLTNFQKMKLSIEISGIYTHLTILTFNKKQPVLCNFLYMSVTHYQNKRLYSILFLSVFLYKFLTDFVNDFALIGQNPCKIWQYK